MNSEFVRSGGVGKGSSRHTTYVVRRPPLQRHAIIQQLIAVAKANLAVATEEQNTLQEICAALEVNPVFPERILGQYEDVVFSGCVYELISSGKGAT